MSTWLDRGASGGLAGAQRPKKNQPTANSTTRLEHRNSDTPTRADNELTLNRWKYASSDYPTQTLPAHYQRDQVVSYFLIHHAPRGEDITEDEYRVLHAEYEAAARAPKKR